MEIFVENSTQASKKFDRAIIAFENYRCTGNKESALEAQKLFQEVIEIVPDCTSARNNLGVLYCEIGQYVEAIKQYEQIPIPDSLEKLYNLAVSYYYSGDYTTALDYVERILKINEKWTNALALRGKINIELNNYNGASKDFNSAFIVENELTYAIWDSYSCYLDAEHVPNKSDAGKDNYRSKLTRVIRKLEKSKAFAKKKYEFDSKFLDSYAATLLFLGCFYSRHKDFLSAKENLIECLELPTKNIVKPKVRELLNIVWNLQLKPSWRDWWTKSPKMLGGRIKKYIFYGLVLVLICLLIFIFLHPLIKILSPESLEYNWSLYLFLIGVIIAIILSPNAESIKTGQIEVELYVPHPLEGVPAPAIIEEHMRILKQSEKNE